MTGPVPSQVETLIELLAFRARETPGRVAFTFEDQAVTFEELWQRSCQFATYLLQRGFQRGDRVVIALPNGADFFFAFYGTQRAGGIAVPLSPASSLDRIESIAAACGASATVLAEEQIAASPLLIHINDSETIAPTVSTAPPQPDDLAYIQYTSGSTGNPKGVMLSHFNLITNVRQLIAGMQITTQDIFVSWLPVYHDMGLILKTMVPFYLAAELHLLPTNLNNVQTWLETIQRRRATFTAAPDFAYRFCLQRVKHRQAYDLSSLRVALNAAEPVRAQTIRDFESTFGLKNVMRPGYGLAEATVGVSMWPPGSDVKIDERGIVSAGRPFPEIDLQIVADKQPLEAGSIGEIAVRSPANTRGYFRNPIETAALFWRNDYILTGDLGYLDADGDLFVVSRKKNIIKQAGETIYPQEIEEAVEALAAVRLAAAIGIDKGRLEGEQAYVFAEVRPVHTSIAALEDLVRDIVNQIDERLGVRPGRVYLVKPHTLPRTHNGKLQHTLLKQSYLSGELRSEGLILYPDY